MKSIAVYGGGGFGREVKSLIEEINRAEETWNMLGFFDDGLDPEYPIDGLKNLGGMHQLNTWGSPLAIVVAVGNSELRHSLVNSISNPMVSYPTLIHPKTIIQDPIRIEMGHGCVITAGTILTTSIVVGNHCILNLNVTVGHDCRLGNFVSIMPGCNLAGTVILDDLVFVGSGTNIINNLRIGTRSKIGAGSVVNRDIPAGCTAVGVPARVVKHES